MTAIRDTASVSVSKPVNGKRRRRAQPARTTARPLASYTIAVDPQVLAAAKQALRPGEKFVIVDEVTMRSVYYD